MVSAAPSGAEWKKTTTPPRVPAAGAACTRGYMPLSLPVQELGRRSLGKLQVTLSPPIAFERPPLPYGRGSDRAPSASLRARL